jgi:hypothetical protein
LPWVHDAKKTPILAFVVGFIASYRRHRGQPILACGGPDDKELRKVMRDEGVILWQED